MNTNAPMDERKLLAPPHAVQLLSPPREEAYGLSSLYRLMRERILPVFEVRVEQLGLVLKEVPRVPPAPPHERDLRFIYVHGVFDAGDEFTKQALKEVQDGRDERHAQSVDSPL